MQTVRGHNDGSLFQRKTGPQRGRWVALVTMRDGRRVSRYGKDRDDAKAQLVELLRLRDAGATMTGRVRLSDYLEAWTQRDHGWAPATARKHESLVRTHIVPALGSIRLSELRVDDVDRLLAGGGPLGGQSRRHVRATLRRALAGAIRDGLVQRNVAALSHPPGLAARERAILDAAQARILIESTRGTRYGPLWTILVTTGLRISEALGLAWSDVTLGGNDEGAGNRGGSAGGHRVAASDHDMGRARDQGGRLVPGDSGHARLNGNGRLAGASITVTRQLAREDGEWVRRQPKTAKGRRTIPLTPLGVEALRAQREQQDADLGSTPRPIDGLVFTSERGNPLHGENMSKLLYRDEEAAALPRVSPHGLRHSAATVLYAMGIPLETIADMLGHSTPRITAELYRHRVQELQDAASDAMQRALG